MATLSAGIIGGKARSSWIQTKENQTRNKKKTVPRRVGVCRASYSPAMADPYKTLRIEPGASESEVKKAFRKLVLQYHPDVCRESNCGVKFHTINEAYDIVMSNLRGETSSLESYETYDDQVDDQMRGMYDPDYDMWEEWMGWEGAGIRDYTSHINPYI